MPPEKATRCSRRCKTPGRAVQARRGPAWNGEGFGGLGGVSVVLAQNRDRFATRPTYHYLHKREFTEHGIRLAALNDHGDESSEDNLTDGILDQFANSLLSRAIRSAWSGSRT